MNFGKLINFRLNPINQSIMMRFIVLSMTFCVLVSCENRPQPKIDQPEKPQTQESETAESESKDRTMNFEHPGVYRGVLPCANCKGIRTKIKITKEGQYFRVRKYLGKPAPNLFEEKGHFSWDPESQELTLDGVEKPNQYLLEDGNLIQLDIKGNRITGDLAGRYVLSIE